MLAAVVFGVGVSRVLGVLVCGIAAGRVRAQAWARGLPLVTADGRAGRVY